MPSTVRAQAPKPAKAPKAQPLADKTNAALPVKQQRAIEDIYQV
jgi:hypothetical protein